MQMQANLKNLEPKSCRSLALRAQDGRFFANHSPTSTKCHGISSLAQGTPEATSHDESMNQPLVRGRCVMAGTRTFQPEKL